MLGSSIKTDNKFVQLFRSVNEVYILLLNLISNKMSKNQKLNKPTMPVLNLCKMIYETMKDIYKSAVANPK